MGKPARNDAPRLGEAAGVAGLNVLVVDDEPSVRELVSTVMRRCHASVIAVASAAQAWEEITRRPIDLLISDIEMPQENGFDLIARVRASDVARIQSMPAVAVTARSLEADRQQALAAGFDAHVAKPFLVTTLAQGVLQAVARSTARSGLAASRSRPGSQDGRIEQCPTVGE